MGIVNEVARSESASRSDARERIYRVKAIWKTLQGEGFFAGRPAVFVRFVGCNMWSGRESDRQRFADVTGADCPMWCDTDFLARGSRPYSADALAHKIRRVGDDIRLCVLTGGEPFLQIDPLLIRALHSTGFLVAVETNGTLSLREKCWEADLGEILAPDWIVCSPKLPEDLLNLEYFDELKLVVPDYMPQDYANFARRARHHILAGIQVPLLWLQPEDGPRFEAAKDLAVETALAHPDWRVSVQTHKLLGVD